MALRTHRWMAGALAAAALTATSLVGPSPAAAEDAAPGATPEELTLFERYDLNASQAAELSARVDELTRTLESAQADLDGAQRRADEADRHLADVRARIADAERQLEVAEASLRNKAIRAYIGGREEAMPPVVEALASHDGSATEAERKAAYSEVVVRDQRSTVLSVTEARDAVRSLQGEAEELRAAAGAERDEVARRRDEIQRQRDELEALRQQAAERVARDLALVGDVVLRGQEHALRTAGTRSASDSFARQLLTRQWGSALIAPATGSLPRPVAGARFSSGFGVRTDPVTGTVARHEGIDFAAPLGTPIATPADGVVLFAGPADGYGNTTLIDHGNGVGTLYGHQDRIGVLPGQPVLRGDVIGAVGSTGKSTGPHLHFEIRLFGVPEEPRPYLAP